jgi:hypothetical protein
LLRPTLGGGRIGCVTVDYTSSFYHMAELMVFELVLRFSLIGGSCRHQALAIRKGQNNWGATPLARQVRELFIRNPTHLCGLIALLNDQSGRITDIDAVLKLGDVAPESLKQKLLQVATRLWLKRPRGRVVEFGESGCHPCSSCPVGGGETERML